MSTPYSILYTKYSDRVKKIGEVSEKLVSISASGDKNVVYRYATVPADQLIDFLTRLYTGFVSKDRLSIILLGSPGIGKSALVHEFSRRICDMMPRHVEEMVRICRELMSSGSVPSDIKRACEYYEILYEAFEKENCKPRFYHLQYDKARDPKFVSEILSKFEIGRGGVIRFKCEVPFIFYDLRTTELMPTDLQGPPALDVVRIRLAPDYGGGEVETKVSTFANPVWALLFTWCPGVFFLDEFPLNEPRPDMRAAAHKILWDHMVGDVKLSPLTMVICASNPHIWNPFIARVAIEGMTPPEINRVLVVYVMPSKVEKWVEYMERKWGKNVCKELLNFLLAFPQYMMAIPEGVTEEDVYRFAIVNLDEFEQIKDVKKYPVVTIPTYENFPTPRSLEQLALALGPNPLAKWGVYRNGEIDVENTVRNLLVVLRGYVGYVPLIGERKNDFIPKFIMWLLTTQSFYNVIVPLVAIPTWVEVAKSEEEVKKAWEEYAEFIDRATNLTRSLIEAVVKGLEAARQRREEYLEELRIILERAFNISVPTLDPVHLIHVVLHVYDKVLDTFAYAKTIRDGYVELVRAIRGPGVTIRDVAEVIAPFYYAEKERVDEEDIRKLTELIEKATHSLRDVALAIWQGIVELTGFKDVLKEEEVARVKEFLSKLESRLRLYRYVVEEKKLINQLEWRTFINLAGFVAAVIYISRKAGRPEFENIWRRKFVEKIRQMFTSVDPRLWEIAIKLCLSTPVLIEVLKLATQQT